MGNVRLSPEAEAYFAKKNCKVLLQPTPKAIHVCNRSTARKIGLFHVTCWNGPTREMRAPFFQVRCEKDLGQVASSWCGYLLCYFKEEATAQSAELHRRCRRASLTIVERQMDDLDE